MSPRTDARDIAAVAMAVIDTAAPVIVQRDVSPEGAAVAIAMVLVELGRRAGMTVEEMRRAVTIAAEEE